LPHTAGSIWADRVEAAACIGLAARAQHWQDGARGLVSVMLHVWLVAGAFEPIRHVARMLR